MPRFLAALIAWISVPENRKRVYQVLRLLIPALAVTGWISPGEVEVWLAIAQAVLGVTAGVLGAANASAAWRWWLYSVTVAVSLLLAVRGLVDPATVNALLPALAAALSVTGTTVAIRKVPSSPPAGPQLEDGGHR